MEKVILPEGLLTISYGTFRQCESLKSIYIPESVIEIADDAFEESGLETIYGKSGSYAETYAKQNGYEFVEK